MSEPITFEAKVHLQTRRGGRKEMVLGDPVVCPALPPGRVPRVARLMALALRFQGLLREGNVADYAELARLGHVSRARISQIMNLLHLAPDIQEALLFLPLTERGRDKLRLAQLQPIAASPSWRSQRRLWADLARSTGGSR